MRLLLLPPRRLRRKRQRGAGCGGATQEPAAGDVGTKSGNGDAVVGASGGDGGGAAWKPGGGAAWEPAAGAKSGVRWCEETGVTYSYRPVI